MPCTTNFIFGLHVRMHLQNILVKVDYRGHPAKVVGAKCQKNRTKYTFMGGSEGEN